jgi:glycosyltransferase involved in cell wall biosynthesis
MGALVERADVIIAPSASVARLVALVHPRAGEKIRRIDWGATARERVAVTGRSGPLRVAIIGVLADVKGASRLPELLSACRDLDVEWHLFGAREGRPLGPIRRAAPRVVVHGSYRRSELARRLNGAACELALLPSIAPEAFGLVLSELAAAGCPALVSNLGALPERIAELGAGFVFDPWNPAELRAKLAPLVDNRQRLVEAARVLGQVPPWTPVEMAEAHLELWREVMQRGPRRAVGSPERAAARRRLDAERRTSAPVRAAARAVRRSAFYRDLGVRGWLPEAFRARCEQAAKSVLDRLLDRRGSR